MKHLLKLSNVLLLMLAISITGCNKDEEDSVQQLSNEQIEQITLNLSKNDEVGYELLTGKWKPIKFAYTADGIKVSDVATISAKYTFNVPDEYRNSSDSFSFDDELLGPMFFTNFSYFYSRSSNLISYAGGFNSQVILPNITDDDRNVSRTLTNACSFVVKGNELIIYFTGDKNKNLLILKKLEL